MSVQSGNRLVLFRRLIFAALLFFMLAAAGMTASAKVSMSDVRSVSGGEFVKNGSQYYYQYKNGGYAKNCLLEIDGKIYCFAKSGRRRWSWQTIDGEQYYFGTKRQGYMYKKAWYTDKKTGKTYRLLKTGQMAKGLTKIGNNYYYFNKKTGVQKTGWKKISGKYYYFKKSNKGKMLKSKWLTYKGDKYYLTSDGSRASGWQTISGKKYYFKKSSGIMVTGKKTIGGVTYYFDKKTGALLYSGAKLSISSDCAVLIDTTSGKTLYDKNGDTQHANASTTKILTCILALENCKTSETVTVSSNAASQEPSKIYLHTGEKVKLKDLLYAMMLPSGNDAAVAVAEHVSGSTSKFATLMNNKAKAIGCKNTHFVTPNGLDQGLDHYTTANDLAKIAAYAYQNSTFRNIVKTVSYSFTSESGYSYSMTNTNSLLTSMTGVTGMKTGFTNKAGYCFVGSIKGKNGHTYISVVLGGSTSSERWTDSKTLLDYAYNLT